MTDAITLTLSENEAEHLLYLVRTSNCLDHGPTMAPQKTTICKDLEVKIEDQMPRFDYELVIAPPPPRGSSIPTYY